MSKHSIGEDIGHFLANSGILAVPSDVGGTDFRHTTASHLTASGYYYLPVSYHMT